MTMLPPNECAIVSTNNMTGIEIYVPDRPHETEIPAVMMYLMACATRFHKDPAFVREQIDWFEKFENTLDPEGD